jgi:hypothetical protein
VPDRVKALDEQIAHLKVLWADADEILGDTRRNMVAWTKRVMVSEAIVASFDFRIQEMQAERANLLKPIRSRRKKGNV